MYKLLIALSTITMIGWASAISLGDKIDQQTAVQTNTVTSATKLVAQNNKTSTYQSTSSHGSTKMLVNNSTKQVYSISWDDQQAVNLQDILGSTYYPEFKIAAKKPQMRIPRRAISIDDGNLSVHQFGSMSSGMHGTATVQNLAPQN